MAEQASSAEGDLEPESEKTAQLPVMSLQVGPGVPPQDYDVIIGSYDGAYSGSGALHQYLVRELGLEDAEQNVVLNERGYRLIEVRARSTERIFFLGQVVSIHDGRRTVPNTEANLVALLSALDQKIGLDAKRRVSLPISVWIPTIATGSAGLSHVQSASLIARAIKTALNFPFGPSVVGDIMVAPPKSVSEAENAEIIAAFSDFKPRMKTADDTDFETVQSEPQTVSEMPNEFHSDHALENPTDDQLGRDAIAETIATNVGRVWKEQKRLERPFAIHLSGRWGSGKSSILGFLGAKLKKDGWVVVNYNAWRMQEAGPPWWSLLTTVREQGYAALGPAGLWPRLTDWIWRKTRIAWPWLGTLLVIAALIMVFQLLPKDDVGRTVTITTSQTLVDEPEMTSVQRTVTPVESPGRFVGSGSAWAFVLAIITGLGSLGAMAKLIQGWNRSATETAEAVRALQSDPAAAVKARFERVISNINRPVVVFIDDLDRCDARFVVEQMQSLQTAYSNVAVLYVVASDRDWIVSAYNQIYDGFQSELSKPGAPLGYLFVKKIFQLSVPVPDLAGGDRTRLAQALLNTQTQNSPQTATREERASEIRDAAAEGDLSRVTEIQSAALAEGQNLAPEVMRAVSDPANQTRLRHKLLDYASEFDGNPRAIKRLINALTFRQGYILTAAEDIPFDHIARWTILALRFPYTADLLAARPSEQVPDHPTNEFPDPAAIRSILGTLTPEDIGKVAAFG